MIADPSVTALGLMSGTSMDGLDCCLCKINLTNSYILDYDIVDWKTFSYNADTKNLIQKAINNPDTIPNADKNLGLKFSEFAVEFLNGRKVDVIGSHGQTVSHQDGVSTTQIGNPKPLFDAIGSPVIFNFRQADINADGNGAPLMPFLDWLLFRDSEYETITLNIGGIANLTHISPGALRNEVIGFDTGPGMALIDECVKLCWGEQFDQDGKYSSKGKIIPELLEQLIQNEFIHKLPPKSTGRHEFGVELVKKIFQNNPNFRKKDILRTFITLTAKSIVFNIQKHLKFSPHKTRLIISGGGKHHPILISEIQKISGITKLVNLTNFEVHQDNKEAFLMAVLAVAKIQSLPANMQCVTGSTGDVVLGDIWE